MGQMVLLLFFKDKVGFVCLFVVRFWVRLDLVSVLIFFFQDQKLWGKVGLG